MLEMSLNLIQSHKIDL